MLKGLLHRLHFEALKSEPEPNHFKYRRIPVKMGSLGDLRGFGTPVIVKRVRFNAKG